MIELVEARDQRLLACGGRWFGDYETPTILSKAGRVRLRARRPLNARSYGRKNPRGNTTTRTRISENSSASAS